MVGTEPSKFHTASFQDPRSGSLTDLGPSRGSLGHLQVARQQEPIGKTQAMEACGSGNRWCCHQINKLLSLLYRGTGFCWNQLAHST